MSDLFDDTEVDYAHSEVESRRFGRSVARLTVPFAADLDASLPRVMELLASSVDDVVIMRYPSSQATWFATLLGTGRDLLYADAMVYFERALAESVPEFPDGWDAPDLRLAEGHEVDAEALVGVIPQIFDQFVNHYRANPMFDPDAAVAGYQEWVQNSLRRDRVVCVIDERSGPQGFLALNVDAPRAELLIGGVAPPVRRRQAFTAILLRAARVAREAGCTSVVGPTHVQNVATQRVFGAAGYLPVASVTTVHAVRPGLLSPRRA